MNKNQMNGKKMAAIVIISALVCSVAWISPSFYNSGKSKPANVKTSSEQTKETELTGNTTEESQLVAQLQKDGRIDEVKGFVVEKKQNMLFINGQQMPDNIATKYISTLKKDEIRVEVYPFMERLRQHPDASFIQILFPVMMESPCVDQTPKKPGC